MIHIELVELLESLKRGSCWCEMGIGNPMNTWHTTACLQAQEIVDQLKGAIMLTFKHDEVIKALTALNEMANQLTSLGQQITVLQQLFDTSLTPDVKALRDQVDNALLQVRPEQRTKLQDMYPDGIPDTELENVFQLLQRTIDKNKHDERKQENADTRPAERVP